jgi:hypothetical protein
LRGVELLRQRNSPAASNATEQLSVAVSMASNFI